MSIQNQIKDLWSEKLRLENERATQKSADNIEQQAKIQAIDSQLDALRNQLAKNYNIAIK